MILVFPSNSWSANCDSPKCMLKVKVRCGSLGQSFISIAHVFLKFSVHITSSNKNLYKEEVSFILQMYFLLNQYCISIIRFCPKYLRSKKWISEHGIFRWRDGNLVEYFFLINVQIIWYQ